MLYGVERWKQAERWSSLDLIDEEEGMVLLDVDVDEDEDGGRAQITEREVEYVEAWIGGDSENADEEVRALVKRAVTEIKAWDEELGKRVKCYGPRSATPRIGCRHSTRYAAHARDSIVTARDGEEVTHVTNDTHDAHE